MAFLQTRIDAVNVINSGSQQEIRLREISCALPLQNSGMEAKSLKEMPDGISSNSN